MLKMDDNSSEINATRYCDVLFSGTHSSCFGSEDDGKRGSLISQLNGGIRYLQFNILGDGNLRGYSQAFCIGKDSIGDHAATMIDGNPFTFELKEWFQLLADWSFEHPHHTPITVGIEMMQPLCINSKYIGRGSLGQLNELIYSVFGMQLFAAYNFDKTYRNHWPEINEMKGRIVFVLSGNFTSCLSYLRCQGLHPCIDVNEKGFVISVYTNTDGELLYWTGSLINNGIDWNRNNIVYDKITSTVIYGNTPDVSMNDSNWVVLVYEKGIKSTLYYKIGRIGFLSIERSFDHSPNSKVIDVEWVSKSASYDYGINPSVNLLNDGTVVEVHKSEANDKLWFNIGMLDKSKGTISWVKHSCLNVLSPCKLYSLQKKSHYDNDTFKVVYNTRREKEKVDKWVELEGKITRGNQSIVIQNSFSNNNSVVENIDVTWSEERESFELLSRCCVLKTNPENPNLEYYISVFRNDNDYGSISYQIINQDLIPDFTQVLSASNLRNSTTQTIGAPIERIRLPQICFVEAQRGSSLSFSKEEKQLQTEEQIIFYSCHSKYANSIPKEWEGNDENLIKLWHFNDRTQFAQSLSLSISFVATDYPHNEEFGEFCERSNVIKDEYC